MRRGVNGDTRDDRATHLRKSELFLVVIIDVVETDSQIATRHGAALSQLGQDVFCDVDGDGEADTLSLLAYRGVDPHDLASGVE